MTAYDASGRGVCVALVTFLFAVVASLAFYSTFPSTSAPQTIVLKALESSAEPFQFVYYNRTYSFSYVDTSDVPLGIYSSRSGQYVVTSTTSGYVYVSTDYGASFDVSRPFKLSGSEYASIYGMAFSSDADMMIAGTYLHSSYVSYDYGSSWSILSDQSCFHVVGTSSLDKVACLSGTTSSSVVMISLDSGASWSSTTIEQGHYVGLVSNTDFSHLATSLNTGSPYFFFSYDEGATWLNTTYDESPSLTWGCLAGDEDLTNIILTDSLTRNVHMSTDNFASLQQIYDGQDLDPSIGISACAISREDNVFGLGFSGQAILSIFGCAELETFHCYPDEWTSQSNASSSGYFNTTSMAFSTDGSYMFVTDSGSLQIAVGILNSIDG